MNPITGKVSQLLKHGAVWTLLLLLTLTQASQAALLYSTNGNTITIIGSNPKASGALVIPSTIDTLPVTAIGDSAFESCTALTSVTIPTSVTSIGISAFYNCGGMKSVTIPATVTSIGSDAFAWCSGLTSVTIPTSITAIGNSVFYQCSGLTSVTIPANVTSIGSDAFAWCTALTSVTIPNSVTSINRAAFEGCSGLTGVTIPTGITSIGSDVFSWCTGLTSVTIPTSVTSIGYAAFYQCSGLTNVTIPTSVAAISTYAFRSCAGLTSVTIPASVTAISASAFRSCTELTSVYFMGNPPSTGIDVFYDTPSTIYYIQGKTGWIATFADRPTAAFEPLAISVQPLPLTVTAGSTASFTVTATGTAPLSYQWRKDGVTIAKATNQTFSLATTTVTDTGLYQVSISNRAATLTSLAAQLTVKPLTPVITSATTATAMVGQPFSYTITANSSPTNYNATGLPAGLSVNTGTGVISGTPTTVATSTITLSASNVGGTGTRTLTLTVNPPTPVITSAATVTATLSRPFSYTITANSSPTSFNATELPAGLSVNTGTGVISGTPTTVATSTITLSASNAGGTGTRTLTLTVNLPPVPVLTSPATASATVGQYFSYAIAANNYPTSFGATDLPTGFSFDSLTGVISGTPTTAATSTITISASNIGGTGMQTLTLTVHPIPVITSPATASTTVGQPFSHTITADYATAPFAATGLPAGLSLNSLTGVISGTPNAAGTSTIIISTSNAFGTGNQTLTLIVHPIPVITSAATAVTTVGQLLSYTITANYATPPFAAADLPAGLSLDPLTGVISGTPTIAGTSTITLSAKNAYGTGSQALILTVTPAVIPVITSAATASIMVGQIFSYTITSDNPVALLATTDLPAGLSLDPLTGVISGTPTTAGTNMITLSASIPFGTGTLILKLTVNPIPIPVITSAATASVTIGQSFRYIIRVINETTSFGATGLPAGLSLNSITGVISGTPTAAGTSTITLSAVNTFGTGSLTLTLTVNPIPVVTSAATATATMGQMFSYTITADHATTPFATTELPAGLSLNSATGVISGTPTAAGTSTIKLSASNAFGTVTKTLTLTVNPTPVITSAATATAMVGQLFNYTITTDIETTLLTAKGLPQGLILDSPTGVISGRPTTAGTSTITLSAINAFGTGSLTLTLTVNPIPIPMITSAATATATLGQPFRYTIVATHTPTSFAATDLPGGLSLDLLTGVISGTPSTAGTSTIALSAINAFGTGNLTLTLTVNAMPVITSATTATATVGQFFSHTITANNAPTKFTATGLPAGLSLNSVTGVISGKPTTAGTKTITLSAINPFGTGSQTLTLTVYPAPIITIIQGIAGNGFSLLVRGEPNQEHVIEYTTNFQQWVPLATNVVGATDWTLEDPQGTENAHRFYRVFKR